MTRTSFMQHVIDILEILIVAALVRCQSNTLYIFLDSGIDYFFSTSIVAQVDYFSTRALHDPSHDVNSSIVSIKKGCRRHDADMMFWLVCGYHLFLSHD